MKFAMLNGNKIEASIGMKGECPSCGAEMIAKCGNVKIHHWAHKGIRQCDPWWENETTWHRQWKNNFPAEWQEISLKDLQTNETHIADVRTADGLVIEFQHSAIHPQERTSREIFYQNLVWIIDGTRLKRDYPRFLEAWKTFRKGNSPGRYIVDIMNDMFPQNWLGSPVPVIFDFQGSELLTDPKDFRQYLFCLMPQNTGRYAELALLTRNSFVESTHSGQWSSVIHDFLKSQQLNKSKQILTQQQPVNNRPDWVFYNGRYVKRRRF